jgi:hypothetical protein
VRRLSFRKLAVFVSLSPANKRSLFRAEVRIVPFTPEALAKRAQIVAVYAWFRERLVLIVVAIMLILQFMTWRSIERVAENMPRSPDCSYRSPCYVQGTVSLDENTIRQIRPK